MNHKFTPFQFLFCFFLLFFIADFVSAQYKFQRSFEKLNFYNGSKTSDGGYVATGLVSGFGAGNEDVFLLKLMGYALLATN